MSLTIHSKYKYFDSTVPGAQWAPDCTESWRQTAEVSLLPFAVNVMVNLSIIQLNLENIRGYCPIFKTAPCVAKYLKDNNYNSLHLGRKYAWIFVLGHYLFLEVHSFPRATLSKNCSLLRTDSVRGQISCPVFEPNGGSVLFSYYYALHIVYKATNKLATCYMWYLVL